MPIGTSNYFFQPYTNTAEQNLVEALIVEAMQIYGLDCYYVARSFKNLDQIYGTDDSSAYTAAWRMVVYPKNVLGYTGDREFISKFAGLEVRDQVIFSISRYIFNQVVATDARFPGLPNNAPLPSNRPREGDLIFIPLEHLNKVFQIKYVNLTDMFFQLGKIYTWECTCELFEYSSEIFNTGIADVDRIQVRGDLNLLDYLLYDTDGVTPLLVDPWSDYWVTDAYNLTALAPFADNIAIDSEANTYINFAAALDPFADTGPPGTLSPTI